MVEKVLDAHVSVAIADNVDDIRSALYKFEYWFTRIEKRLKSLGIDWEVK